MSSTVSRTPSGISPARWLTVIVAGAFLARSLFLLLAVRRGPRVWWSDPDGYTAKALALVGDQGWSWNFEAFTYYGVMVKAPLYPFVLSAFALFPPVYHLAAAWFQVALATAAVPALYVLGRELHSPRAGLIAAAVYAVWLPVLAFVPIFLQEQLHVPLVIAGMALLVRAAARSASNARFAVAGGVLGLAALARSMPLYYLGPAALLYIWASSARRVAARQAVALVLGFLIVVLPWCVYVSARTGRVILIDNMGSAALGMTYREVRPEIHTAPPATVGESLIMLWRAATRDPARFWGDRVADFRRLFRLVGGQWLELQPPVASRHQALLLKMVAHASDALAALAMVLAPIGVVLLRRRREGLLVALWAALHLGLLVMFAWNGVRYRAPYEPVLIVLSAVVVSGGWVRPGRLALGAAIAVSLAIAAATAASLPETASARARYGFDGWLNVDGPQQASFVGAAGFGVLAQDGSVTLVLQSAAGGRMRREQVRVHFDGQLIDQVTFDGRERRLQYVWTRPAAFVELEATFEDTGAPAPMFVEVPAPWK
jgi:hypothetical protein